jgi:hypothetical protein
MALFYMIILMVIQIYIKLFSRNFLQLSRRVHFHVLSSLVKQPGICTHFNNRALIHHYNAVCIMNGGKPVGDDKTGAVGCLLFHGVLNKQLSTCIDRRCNIVFWSCYSDVFSRAGD